MGEPSKTLGSMRFGPFDLSVETGELRKNGVRLKLTGQPIQVLIRLVVKRGSLVTREELQRELWGSDIFGDPTHGLNAAVNRLREALGDSATEPKYIETVPGRGYRFLATLDSPLSPQVQSDSVVTITRPQPESPGQKVEPQKPRWWKRRATIAASVAIVLALFLWLKIRSAPPGGDQPIHSLAVLPLTNLSHDPEQEYFADGMTEALITELSQISSLKVISRTSAMHYKGSNKPLPEIAKELNVDGVIEGSVLRADGRVASPRS